MNRSMWVSSAAVVLGLVGCSAPDPGPTCASDDAQRTLLQLVWQDVEQQFSQRVGAENAKHLLDLTRQHLTVQFSGITTTETSKEVRQVTCQTSLTTTVPDTLKYDLTMLRTAMAKERDAQIEDRTITGHVEYRVTQSDDRKTIRVEARGQSTFASVLGAIGSAYYAQSMASTTPISAGAATTTATGSPSVEAQTPSQTSQSEYAAADARLNAAYQAARASMTEAQRTSLRDEQRAWIRRRDESCSEARIESDSKGDVAGGSAMEMAVMACKTKITDERARQLVPKG